MATPALNSEEEKQAALEYAKRMEEFAKTQTTIPPIAQQPVPQPNPVEVALVPTEPLVPVEIPPAPPVV